MNFEYFLNKFEVTTRNNNKAQARCPAHDDKQASLTITETEDKILMHCFTGCKTEDILKAVGLEIKDLNKKNWTKENYHVGDKNKVFTIEQIKSWPWTKEVYEYRNKENLPYLLSLRKTDGQKGHPYAHMGDGKFRSGLNGKKAIPYRLPEVLRGIEDGKKIYIPEGEKDVDTLRKYGLIATTNMGGANNWKSCLNNYFKDARVVLLYDNDDAGRLLLKIKLRGLSGIAKEIQVIDLPGVEEKEDITDWLDKGHTIEEFLQIEENTSLYIPTETEDITEESENNQGRGIKFEVLIQVERYLRKNFEFRFNIITQKPEIKILPGDNWEQITDNIVSSLYFSLLKQGIDYTLQDLRQLIINPDFAKYFDPFLDYFKNLNYNGPRDYIKDFTDCFVLKNEEERSIFEEYFKKWFVGILTGVYNDTWCNHCMFIITGEQGDGKTTILNKLIPEKLKQYLKIGLCKDSKDAALSMCSNLLINADELESFSKKDVDYFKSVMTQKYFDIRPPYGHFLQKFTKRCSFMASTNKTGFLTDTTGSRRFLIFEVVKVLYEKPFDIDKMYSQAKYLYQAGFQYFFTKEEIGKINFRNNNFSTDSLEEELLLKYFRPTSVNALSLSETEQKIQGIYFLSTTEIAAELTKKVEKLSLTDGFVKKLGAYLRKHNFLRTSKFHRYGWWVKMTESFIDCEYSLN